MTTDEQRIFVAEWMFPEYKRVIGTGMFSGRWIMVPLRFPNNLYESDEEDALEQVKELPALTLDWLHECWLKLTLDQKIDYLRKLSHSLACSFVDHLNIFDLVQLEDATAEQRLSALMETISSNLTKK